jgi:thioredoxin 1
MLEETKRKIIPVLRMDCPTCVGTIEAELFKLKGIREVRVNFLMKRIVVDYDPEKISVLELEDVVERLGYRIAYKKYDSFLKRISKVFRRKNEEKHELKKVDDHTFEELVLQSNKPVILFFVSQGCPTCKIMIPRISDLQTKFTDRIDIYELNIMETKIWEDYNVLSVPTLLFLKKGEETERIIGLATDAELDTKTINVLRSIDI